MRRTIGAAAVCAVVLELSCGTEQKKGDTVTCTDDDLQAGCTAGACHLSAPRGTLPNGEKLTLSRAAVPAELAGDAIGDTVCTLALPADREDAADLDLAVDQPADVTADAALFQHVTTGDPDALVVASRPRGTRAVSGLVRHSGTYGATRRPGAWAIEAIAGVDASGSADPASFLRNVSTKALLAAFYDGTRLYVGSENRLLVWNAMPKDPTVPPDVVLGQPSLDSNVLATSAAVWRTAITAIWSDGAKLAVATGNRVLVWQSIPTASGAAADVVLGQPDFATDSANTGGVSAETMNIPYAIDSDGTRLLVADSRNNRALAWSAFPTTNGQAATGVVGQPAYNVNAADDGAARIYQTYGVALDGPGAFVAGYFYDNVSHVPSLGINPAPDFSVFPAATYKVTPDACYLAAGVAKTASGFAVRDMFGARLAMFASVPAAPNAMDFVLGQPDLFRTVWSPRSASTFNGVNPYYGDYTLSAHGDVILVPDRYRVLVFQKPTYDYEPAVAVLGQASFATNEASVDYRGISARALGAPRDVAASGSTVAIADAGNNRVLIYDVGDLASPNPAAKVVLGQPSETSFLAGAGASGMSAPGGVAFDGAHLAVADSANHRVLLWNTLPGKSGAAADIVLGQADFAGARPNRGRGDVSPKDGISDADSDGFFEPAGVASDGTHLVVADRLNHRVLVWNAWPTQNGQRADAVIGQASFTEVKANRGNGPFTVVADGLNLPLGVTVAQGALWVADTENNRVVRWDAPFTAPAPGAFLGQPDGTTVTNPNVARPADYNAGSSLTPATSVGSVIHPRGVAVSSGRVFVSEPTSNRVHVFDAGLAPVAVWGQTGLDTSGPNAGGLSAASLSSPLGVAAGGNYVYVADSANNRVLRFDALAISGAPASDVVGQYTTSTNGFDQGGVAKAGATSRPRGVAVSRGEVFVCDTDDNRVLVYDDPITQGGRPKRVPGQPDDAATLPNAGGPVSAGTLFGPRGVHATAKWLAVADTRNNRVLLFDRAGGDSAEIVLGQPDAHTTARAPASAATLAAPEGVFVDADALYVADTGDHRVLVWSHMPASSGQPADIVLGQAAPTDALPNRGGGASATTLSGPAGVVVARGAVWVADAGNNRLLRWGAAVATGAAADAVFGQADFTSRSPATDPEDLARLAGPVALATDDTFVYALDRDLARVVAFAATAPTGSGAVQSYGSLGGLSLATPGGLAVERTPLFTSRLYVGDTGQNRVVVVGGASRLR